MVTHYKHCLYFDRQSVKKKKVLIREKQNMRASEIAISSELLDVDN